MLAENRFPPPDLVGGNLSCAVGRVVVEIHAAVDSSLDRKTVIVFLR